jgi:hypothetical protein
MKIRITRSQLVDYGMCPEGLSWYDSHAPSGVWEADWTVGLQVALLRERAEFITWAVRKGLLPLLSMQGVDLGGANLKGVDFRGADLTGAYLGKADLTGADLGKADLTGADLGRADLSGADLSGADLSGAHLGRANLTGANLKGAVRYPSDRPIRGWHSGEGVLVRE